MTEEWRKEARKNLWELHASVISRFLEILKADEPVRGSTFQVIIQFLKDNGITLNSFTNHEEAKGYLEALQTLPFPNFSD